MKITIPTITEVLMLPNKWYDSINDLWRMLIMIGIYIVPIFIVGFLMRDWDLGYLIGNLSLGLSGLYRIFYAMLA